MSDRNLRRILQEIIDDMDAGRLRPRRPRRRVRWLGAPVLAASLGLGLGVAGCDGRAIGYVDDAGVQVDAGSSEDYAAPPVDAGVIYAYGVPPLEVDATMPEIDAGAVDSYGVPFYGEDASIDPPPESLYSAPAPEIDSDADAGAPSNPDPPDPE